MAELRTPTRDHGPLADRHVQAWARGTLRIAGVRVHIEGLAPPPPQRARLVVANHRSALDIPLMMAHFGGAALSRGDLQDWPLLGHGAKKAGCIFVDREDPLSGALAIRQIRGKLQARGSVSLFPEGTTFPGDEVRPFSRGAFVAARGLEVEIVHVGIAHPEGTEFVEEDMGEHVANFAARKRLQVCISIGEPQLLVGRPKAIAEQARDEVQAHVARARTLARSYR